MNDLQSVIRRWMTLIEAQEMSGATEGAETGATAEPRMFFLRDTTDPHGDLQRNFSCYVGAWTANHQQAIELAKTSLLGKPLQDPKTKQWCYDPELGLSSFAFHNLASLHRAYRQIMSEFYVGSGDKVAVFTSHEYELAAGADGEDVFRNGRFVGYAPATIEDICALVGWPERGQTVREAAETGGADDVVDIKGNWRRFDELPADANVLLYHATSNTAAKAILQSGFRQDSKVWANSVNGYVFLGGTPRSIEMYGLYATQRAGGGGKHAIVSVKVRKGDLLPDDGKDWVVHCKTPSHRAFVVDWFGKAAIRQPTATATFACIGQVRAPVSRVTPLAVLDLDNLGW